MPPIPSPVFEGFGTKGHPRYSINSRYAHVFLWLLYVGDPERLLGKALAVEAPPSLCPSASSSAP